MNTPDPKIFGILNITEDSFSDGAVYLDSSQAIEHAKYLIKSGADAIDLGPSASNPDAKKVSAKEEIDRIKPVLEELSGKIPFSLDSYNPDTQIWGLENGLNYLNDIHGFSSQEIYPYLARSECKLIVMHSTASEWKAGRNFTDPSSIFSRVTSFFEERISDLVEAGVSRDRIIIDPGMGYFLGSNPEASINILKRLPDLKKHIQSPVLISVSRKSFLRNVTGRSVSESLPATLAAELFAALSGVDYIRTHDVRSLKDALKVLRILGT